SRELQVLQRFLDRFGGKSPAEMVFVELLVPDKNADVIPALHFDRQLLEILPVEGKPVVYPGRLYLLTVRHIGADMSHSHPADIRMLQFASGVGMMFHRIDSR